MESIGILYVATGEKYIKAAICSAETVRKYCPQLPIHLFANWQEYNFSFDQHVEPFTTVGQVQNPHRRSKVDYMSKSPFDRTLYLDTDTALNADIQDVFQILDRFDVALCHSHRRNQASRTQPWRIALPNAFPQFNSGVFLYRKTPAVTTFLNEWAAAFYESGFPQDQLTLREMLWLSNLRIATLPPEYNVRYMKYHYLWRKREAVTKIFHLRRFHAGHFWFITRILKKIKRKSMHNISCM